MILLRLNLLVTGRQLRAARALAGIEQLDLAKSARVNVATIRRMESFIDAIGCHVSTLTKVQLALEKAGVELLNDGQPGVRLKVKSKRTRR